MVFTSVATKGASGSVVFCGGKAEERSFDISKLASNLLLRPFGTSEEEERSSVISGGIFTAVVPLHALLLIDDWSSVPKSLAEAPL
jgi:hypothetical protein